MAEVDVANEAGREAKALWSALQDVLIRGTGVA